jgi:CRISPR/Cas system-associated exonuclease Cas4 (RecB family)
VSSDGALHCHAVVFTYEWADGTNPEDAMKISPSRITKYMDCPRQYYYAYEMGIQQQSMPAALPFGKACHEGIEYFLREQASAGDVNVDDVVDTFNIAWTSALEEQAMHFSAGWSPEELAETGRSLMAQFPDYWDRQQLVPVFDNHGEPMIEKHLTGKIGGRTCQCVIDLVALNADGEVVVVDWKTPAQQSPKGFEDISDQLTLNLELLSLNLSSLGLEGLAIGGAGYAELLKRKVPKKGSKGAGPHILDPVFAAPRSPELRQDFFDRLNLVAEGIANKRFPRNPRMAYNSPCQMCDFRDYCIRGDTEGLTFPAEQQQAAIA